MSNHSTDDGAEKSSFSIRLEATGRDACGRPPVVRLRQLLKIALRGLGLRCTEVTETATGLEMNSDG